MKDREKERDDIHLDILQSQTALLEDRCRRRNEACHSYRKRDDTCDGREESKNVLKPRERAVHGVWLALRASWMSAAGGTVECCR